MTSFQFWNGLDTIGGNIVEIKTNQARVICDFGLTGIGQDLGDTGGLSDAEFLIAEGFMPAIPGLYDTGSFQQVELSSWKEDGRETAIFVSHLHLDHMGLLKHLPARTSVYVSAETKKLYEALVAVGEEEAITAELVAFPEGESITVGDITVQPLQSDHDTVGICAFFIETPQLRLIHSGDVRLTGYYPERVEQWTSEARAWGADVLLLEGTSFSFEETEEADAKAVRLASEAELVASWRELLRSTSEIIFYNPYIRNVDRLKRIAEVTQAEGRTFVLEAAYARLLHAFYPHEKWTVLLETAEPELDAFAEGVTLEQLTGNPERYILQNSFKHLDFTSRFSGGIYAHSNGEPLGAYDDNYGVMLAKLAENRFLFRDYSVSGHATREHLMQIAKAVGATYTVPWHTFSPERMYESFREEGVPTFLPEMGKVYEGVAMSARQAEAIAHEGQ